MSTFNDCFKNDADYLKFLEDDNNIKKNDIPLSQLYHRQPPMDEDTTKQKKRTKHRFTDLSAGFAMKGDITEIKSLSSVQGSIREQSFNTSKYSKRQTDYAEVLLIWDETANGGLKKEEQ